MELFIGTLRWVDKKMYIHLDQDNKIDDICMPLGHGHNNFPNEEEYIETDDRDLYIVDTWDFENNVSLKDSLIRFEVPPKSDLELLKDKYDLLESRLDILEK